MDTLLSVIKQYPVEFMATLHVRADTTPSKVNHMMHETLADCIASKMWDDVANILILKDYRKPLEGVVFSLKMDYDYDTKSKIIDLFEEGKLV